MTSKQYTCVVHIANDRVAITTRSIGTASMKDVGGTTWNYPPEPTPELAEQAAKERAAQFRRSGYKFDHNFYKKNASRKAAT